MTDQIAATSRGTHLEGSDHFLRLALKLDAVVTGLNGAAYLSAASVLADVFDMSPTLLREVGMFLVVFAVVVWVVGSRSVVSRPATVLVVLVNAGWVAASVAAATAGLDSPSTVAQVWMVAQAAVVALFAALQVEGLRRQRT